MTDLKKQLKTSIGGKMSPPGSDRHRDLSSRDSGRGVSEWSSYRWDRGETLAGTAIQRWCRGRPELYCPADPSRPEQEAWGGQTDAAGVSVITDFQDLVLTDDGLLSGQKDRGPCQVTHTTGPGAARNLCSPFCPPGATSLSASSGKMAWELRRLIQFTTTVCTDDSSAWRDRRHSRTSRFHPRAVLE